LAVFIFVSKSEYFKDASYFEGATLLELHTNKSFTTPRLRRYIEEDKIPISCPVLMAALEYKNEEITKHLVTQGIDLNSTDCTIDFRSLPVGFAMFKAQGDPDMEMMEYLVSKGLNLNYIDDSGNNLTILLLSIYAIYNEITPDTLNKIIEISKKYDANINHENNLGLTPIVFFLDQPELLKVMLEAGANIHYKNKKGETILSQVINTDQWGSIHMMVEHKTKAYVNGFVIDAVDIFGSYERPTVLKRIKEAPAVIKRWKQNIKGNNLQLDCKFAIKGGDNTPKNSVTTDKKTEHLTMFKRMNAYVFGGCSKGGFYHYQVQDKNGRVYHTEYNLHWSDSKEPIKDEKGGYHAVWFNKKFEAEIAWYRTSEMTHDWQHTIGKTKPIRKQKITVF